jgi:SAM-dependent methyltransferase
MTINTKCEICNSTNLTPVLDLGLHPLCDDLLKIGSLESCEEFKIEIVLCNQCFTAHHLYPVPKRKLFPNSYHYRSAMTQDVLIGMKDLVEKLKVLYGDLSNKKIVDVGCNDGSLLAFFRNEGASVFGIEPTDASKDAKNKGIRVISNFFDDNTAGQILNEIGFPDFITFTNVFAHIENITELISAVSIIMGPNTKLIIENHYLGSVLDSFQFDTFYHEHPRTYSVHSFFEIAKRLGRNIESIEFPSRYGGNIRVCIGNMKAQSGTLNKINAKMSYEKSFLNKFEKMNIVIKKWLGNTELMLLNARAQDGRIYAKAFPGRAAILIKMLNVSDREIVAVYEKPNSKKIGHYVPGTKIPILSDDDFQTLKPRPDKVLNLAWHISKEIKKYMEKSGLNCECIDIYNPKDYKFEF